MGRDIGRERPPLFCVLAISSYSTHSQVIASSSQVVLWLLCRFLFLHIFIRSDTNYMCWLLKNDYSPSAASATNGKIHFVHFSSAIEFLFFQQNSNHITHVHHLYSSWTAISSGCLWLRGVQQRINFKTNVMNIIVMQFFLISLTIISGFSFSY